MSSRLSGSKLAEILTEPCPSIRTISSRHCFRPIDDWDDLVLTCQWCKLELNLCSYSYDRKGAKEPAAEDRPAPEWLSEEFHDSKCFLFPEQSGYIDPSLFWYWVERIRGEQASGKIGRNCESMQLAEDTLTIYGASGDLRFLKGFAKYFDAAIGIEFVYVNSAYEPKWASLEEYLQCCMRVAAESNFEQLRRGKIKPECAHEAAAEIEHQLSMIPAGSKEHDWHGRPRAVFKRFESWKKSHKSRKAAA